MKKVVLFILLLVGCSMVDVWASRTTSGISDEAKFYLVTCEAGDEVYAKFGHSGIRVYDAVNGIDEVFHWGLFSFDTPNFVGRFISGNTDYEMGVFATRYFMREYVNRGSAVYAQELDLTPEQKHLLWDKLWDNYRPENRKYRYNFIYDNCATRAYQLILSTYRYHTVLDYELPSTTYRDIINKYTTRGTIVNTGINIIIGKQADKQITTKESVAFPLYAMDALNHTKYIKDDCEHNVVKKHSTLFMPESSEGTTSDCVFDWTIVVALLLAMMCAYYTYRKKRYVPYLTQLIMIVLSLLGYIIGYLWFFSQHPLVGDNANILWCNPLFIILAILLFFHKKGLRMLKFILSAILLFCSIVYFCFFVFNVQAATMSVFALFVLSFTVNATVFATYKSKLKKLIPYRRHK